MAETVERFGVSVSGELLAKFDEAIERRQYPNRSEALRDLMRDFLVEEEWARGRPQRQDIQRKYSING